MTILFCFQRKICVPRVTLIQFFVKMLEHFRPARNLNGQVDIQ